MSTFNKMVKSFIERHGENMSLEFKEALLYMAEY
jgi:hypothetical protein